VTRRLLNEDAIVKKLRRLAPLIGDDCAVISTPRDVDLLFTTDFSIEGVHFTRKSSAEQIGYRAVARSLSDIAAMGGTPLYCLVSIALAPWTNQRWSSPMRSASRSCWWRPWRKPGALFAS